MKKLQFTINRILAKKKLDRQALGSIAVKTVRDFFCNSTDIYGDKFNNCDFDGFVKHQTIFIKTNNQELKIQLFIKKQKILQKVNEKLKRLGFKLEMKEIRGR